MTEILQNLPPDSYIDNYSRECNLFGKSFSYRCDASIGHFDDLFSINIDEPERASKRARIEDMESIDQHILKVTGLESKKMIFYPGYQTVSALLSSIPLIVCPATKLSFL